MAPVVAETGLLAADCTDLGHRRPRIADGLACSCLLATPGEQIGHLDRRARGVGALVDARLGLLDRVHRQDAERDGYAGLQAGELEARRRLTRHVLEVRRLATHDAAERN